MPTFNQLVRKGREAATYKSTAPAISPEERCVHCGSYRHPQEAELRSA